MNMNREMYNIFTEVKKTAHWSNLSLKRVILLLQISFTNLKTQYIILNI
jgi:hypothetical protein